MTERRTLFEWRLEQIRMKDQDPAQSIADIFALDQSLEEIISTEIQVIAQIATRLPDMDAREQLQTRSNIYRFLNRIEDQQSRRFANQGWLRDSITWASIAPQVVVLCDLAIHHDRYHRNIDGLRLRET